MYMPQLGFHVWGWVASVLPVCHVLLDVRYMLILLPSHLAP